MSLEQQITALTEAVTTLNETMQIMVSKAKAAAGGAGETASTETATKKTRASSKTKAKDDDAASDDAGNTDDDTVDVDSLKSDIRVWMGEFGKEGAEYNARGEALKAALKKLGIEKVGDASAEDLPRIVNWLEKKKKEGKLAKPADDADDL